MEAGKVITKEEIIIKLRLLCDKMPERVSGVSAGWWYRPALENLIEDLEQDKIITWNMSEALRCANITWKYLNTLEKK